VDSLFAHGWSLGVSDISRRVVAVPVRAPFPQVAMHVIKSPGVRLFLTDRMWRVPVGNQVVDVLFQFPLGLDEQIVRVNRLGSCVVTIPSGLFETVLAVAQSVCTCGSGAAGVFPFGLGGESVKMARRFLLGQLAEPFAELYGIIPGDVINGMVIADYAWFHGFDDLLVLEQHLTLKDARVLPHDAKVLVLGYLVDPHVEAFGDGDLVELLRWLGSWLTWLGSHREGSRRDVSQLESDVR